MNKNNENDEKIDALLIHAVQTNDRLDSIDDNLEEHMARTAVAEKRLELIEEEVRPLLEHFKGFKWLLGALTAFTVVIKVMEFFTRR